MHPERDGSDSQPFRHCDVAAGRVRPIQGRADVVDVSARGDLPGIGRPVFELRRCTAQGVEVERRVSRRIALGATRRLRQALQRVGARGFKQPIGDLAARHVCRHQGFRDELAQVVRHIVSVDAVPCNDRNRCLQIEAADENGEPTKGDALGFEKEVEAPVEGGEQCLMAWQRGAPAPGQHPEPVTEPRGKFVDAQRTAAHGGQFDRQRDAVQAAAHGRRRLGELAVRHETRVGCTHPREEQPQRAGPVGFVARARPLLGHFQRRDAIDVLGVRQQGLAAGCND